MDANSDVPPPETSDAVICLAVGCNCDGDTRGSIGTLDCEGWDATPWSADDVEMAGCWSAVDGLFSVS